jgi:hypothetical protein
MKIKALLFLLLNIPLLLSSQNQIVSNLNWRAGVQQNGPYNLPVYDVSDCTNEDYIDQICGTGYESPNFPTHFAGCPDMIPIWGAPSPVTCNYAAFADYWFHNSFDLDMADDLCHLSAIANIQADQSFTLYINDNFVGSSTDSEWYLLFTYEVKDYLVDGNNDILIRTNNLDGGSCFNYAFAAFCLNIESGTNPEVNIINFENDLIATGVFDTYQWVDCDNNFAAIPGETDFLYTPVISGNYALVATVGVCTDTSDCQSVNIMPSSVSEPSEDCIRHSYPNPTNDGSLLLDIANAAGETLVEVYSVNGVKVFAKTFFSGPFAEVQLPDAQGIYFVKIRNGGGDCMLKVVRGE